MARAYLQIDGLLLIFHCPGCDRRHTVYVKENGSQKPWKWNGNLDLPTLHPSILVLGQPRCHSFVENGKIRFLSDCEHALKGQTVELPEVEPWDWEREDA